MDQNILKLRTWTNSNFESKFND